MTKNKNSTVTEKEVHKEFLTCLMTELNVFAAWAWKCCYT